MNTKVQKWGNSLGVRLPLSITKSLNIRPNTQIEIKLEGKKIVLKPIKKVEYNLSDLVNQINESNCHKEETFGNQTGNEIW